MSTEHRISQLDILMRKHSQLLIEEVNQPITLWWLSFADPELPKGSQFLGVVIVKASGFAWAITIANMRGLNLGGEIAGFPIPKEVRLPEDYLYRRLSWEEANAADNIWNEQVNDRQSHKFPRTACDPQ